MESYWRELLYEEYGGVPSDTSPRGVRRGHRAARQPRERGDHAAPIRASGSPWFARVATPQAGGEG
eukprot:831467-Lingulodinium_polyedra.AAC.1